MSYLIIENLTDGCFIVTDGEHTERLSLFATDGIREVYGGRLLRLERENAKLRELVRRYSEYTDQDRCEGCVLKRSCDDGEIDECWQIAEIREMEKELGVLDE